MRFICKKCSGNHPTVMCDIPAPAVKMTTKPDIINRVREHIGNDHRKASYLLGYLVAHCESGGEVTTLVDQFLREYKTDADMLRSTEEFAKLIDASLKETKH